MILIRLMPPYFRRRHADAPLPAADAAAIFCFPYAASPLFIIITLPQTPRYYYIAAAAIAAFADGAITLRCFYMLLLDFADTLIAAMPLPLPPPLLMPLYMLIRCRAAIIHAATLTLQLRLFSCACHYAAATPLCFRAADLRHYAIFCCR